MQGHRNQDSQRASRKSSGRKRPTTTERVDSYYMTHAETASTSLEDIALDAVLRPSTSASASVNPAANPANTGAHLLHVLESLFIEDTLGATPDAKTLGFVRQLFGLSEELMAQITASFVFKAPLKVLYVGRASYAAGGVAVVDVAVDMPGSCFDDKDYLNHRYHAKRLLYLDCLRVALVRKMAEGGSEKKKKKRKTRTAADASRGHGHGHGCPSRVEWATTLVDPRKPYLVLETSGVPGVVIRVHASLEQKRGSWLKKCGPEAANLRGYVSSASLPSASASASASASPNALSTPMYNHSIVEDLTLGAMAEALASTAGRFPIFADVVALLEVWAGNHGLLQATDAGADADAGAGAGAGVSDAKNAGDVRGLDGGFFAALVALVLRSDDQMQYSTQRMHVFRGALQVLCGGEAKFVCPTAGAKKWGVFGGGGGGGSAQGTSAAAPEPPSRNAWRGAFKEGVLFVSDANPYVNVGARVSRDVLEQASAAAAAASRMLVSSPTPDAIDAIFMKRTDSVMLYDLWCTCEVRGDGAAATSTVAVVGDESDRLELEARVRRVAAEALGDRATLVRVLHSPYSIATNSKGALVAVYSSRTPVLLCCRLHPTISLRSVDVGPPADDAAAASAFRAFWGARSELRRFQNGKICESVVWGTGATGTTGTTGTAGGSTKAASVGAENKHDVVRQLLDYIIPHHCPDVNGVDVPAMALSRALNKNNSCKDGHGALYERACLNGATKLGKILRSLDSESMTLTIVNVQPVAAVLRNAAAFPPVPHLLAGSSLADTSDLIPRCPPAIEVLCQLEGSGKWPDAPVAYAKMKAALGVQLAQTLKSSYGLDAIASEHCVDVLMEGFAYRLVLYSEREPAEAMATIALRQAHQGLISSLAAEHPSFKHCCRLAKLWIARQHLSNHICEEATELVCAAAYTTKISVGATCPTSPEAGFLSFLDIIAHHPWEAQPIVLDGKVAEEAARLMSRMHAIGKAPSMFVVMGGAGASVSLGDAATAANKKLKCVSWTERGPDNVILFRASVLARKSIKAIVSELAMKGSSSKGSIAASVFTHSMKDYDLVVLLRRDALVGAAGRDARADRDNDGRLDHRQHEIAASDDPTTNEAKYSQAVLSGIPKSLVQQRGGSKIKKELLIGFDPLPLFCELLRDRYQHVAIVCANVLDGDTIGIKIKPKFTRPEGVAFDADYGCSVFRPVEGDHPGDMVVVSREAMAQDVLELGRGIVERVRY